mgnify:CR=1 FL=1
MEKTRLSERVLDVLRKHSLFEPFLSKGDLTVRGLSSYFHNLTFCYLYKECDFNISYCVDIYGKECYTVMYQDSVHYSYVSNRHTLEEALYECLHDVSDAGFFNHIPYKEEDNFN